MYSSIFKKLQEHVKLGDSKFLIKLIWISLQSYVISFWYIKTGKSFKSLAVSEGLPQGEREVYLFSDEVCTSNK